MIGASTLTFTGADGAVIAADAWGSPAAPAVLLLHGAGQTRHAWRGTARRLAASGWYAVAVDLRGHGDTDWSPGGRYEIEYFIGDLRAVAAQLASPVLVGASFGGTISLVTAGEADDRIASALVLVDIATQPNPSGVERVRAFMRTGVDGFETLEDVADAVASYLPNRDRPSDIDGLRKNVRQRADGRWVWHWDPAFMMRADSRTGQPPRRVPLERLESAARQIAVPTLLVRGGASDMVTDAGESRLMELMPAAERVVVPRAGHMVAGDENDRFADAVLDFLAKA